MPKPSSSSLPPDVCLLLRADAEQCWLHREVLPVLRQVETSEELPEEQLDAALAYLEAMWDEASARAGQTDAAHSQFRAESDGQSPLGRPAGRYHAAVCVLREIVAERVSPLVQAGDGSGDGREDGKATARLSETAADGLAPRAA